MRARRFPDTAAGHEQGRCDEGGAGRDGAYNRRRLHHFYGRIGRKRAQVAVWLSLW